MHMMDSHAGTHLVPPAYALPAEGFDDATYRPGGPRLARRVREEVRPARHERRDDREGAHRPDAAAPARVIDVTHLLGTTEKAKLARLARDHRGGHPRLRDDGTGR